MGWIDRMGELGTAKRHRGCYALVETQSISSRKERMVDKARSHQSSDGLGEVSSDMGM